ncbi:MAG: carboxypeptidase-like regulatory domain-containing protein, partial [Bacteroidota bacterium]
MVDLERKVSVQASEDKIDQILAELFRGENIKPYIIDRQIILSPDNLEKEEVTAKIKQQQQQHEVSGTVTDAQSGEPLPGVNIVVEGTTTGTTTDMDGEYSIEAPEDATLVFSFVGYQEVTVDIEGQQEIDMEMEQAVTELERVVKVGYGSQQAADVTGSIASTDIEELEPSDISLMQSLHGSISGLDIGQVDEAGEEPSISIRGTISLSGEQDPLVVVDDVIYRGNLIDLDPSDIESVDILKDASATAVYGSQASNGVVMITTTKSGGTEETGPQINFSSQYAFQEPWRELRAQGPEEFMEKIIHSDLEQARTEESGYTERNPDWSETTNFKTNHEIRAYEAG